MVEQRLDEQEQDQPGFILPPQENNEPNIRVFIDAIEIVIVNDPDDLDFDDADEESEDDAEVPVEGQNPFTIEYPERIKR